MSVHTLRLPTNLEHDLQDLVQQTGHTKSYFFIEALKSYFEDRLDYIRAAAILEKIESGQMKTKGFDEVMAKYDLDN